MGMVHEIYEMRILVRAEMTTHMPKLTDTPKRMNWYKVTPFKSWTLRKKVCAIPTSAAPTAVELLFFYQGTQSMRSTLRENGYVHTRPTRLRGSVRSLPILPS
jgi:hypothetical protein